MFLCHDDNELELPIRWAAPLITYVVCHMLLLMFGHLWCSSFGICLVCVLGLDAGTIYPKCTGFYTFKIARYQICDCDFG